MSTCKQSSLISISMSFSEYVKIDVRTLYLHFHFAIHVYFYTVSAWFAIQSPVLATTDLSVCTSVCLSHTGTVSKRGKLGAQNVH